MYICRMRKCLKLRLQDQRHVDTFEEVPDLCFNSNTLLITLTREQYLSDYRGTIILRLLYLQLEGRKFEFFLFKNVRLVIFDFTPPRDI